MDHPIRIWLAWGIPIKASIADFNGPNFDDRKYSAAEAQNMCPLPMIVVNPRGIEKKVPSTFSFDCLREVDATKLKLRGHAVSLDTVVVISE
jgi:hypothetical protein